MIVRKIKLNNFRSHESFALECQDQTTTIIGENGCGKTSILERGAEFYRVELEYCDGRKTVVVFDGQKKEFLAEDKKSRRLLKKSQYPIVLFEPDDLHLVGASPTSRRSYFDRVFGQLSENYNSSLAKYNKALRQRNELLKEEFVRPEDLFSWDILLVKYGTEIAELREKYVQKINQRFTEVYHSIADNEDEVSLDYISEITTESDFLTKLEQSFQRDFLLGHTSFGIHHDNYDFIFNQVKANGSASRGEVRSSVLALKFIEAEMILQVLGKRPVVLLDDVFSELDDIRQQCLVKNFTDNQVILTSVASGELSCNSGL